MNQKPELILALDVDNFSKAKYFVDKIYPEINFFKVGLQLFTACGPKVIEFIQKKGAQVFLDLKFNDIPNTMVNATKEAIKYKVSLLTVHTLSGPTALKEISRASSKSKTKILGVTLLTSICPHFLKDLGIKRTLSQEVLYLARMAKRCCLDGVVCAAQEAQDIRRHLGKNFLIVSPGIRPKGFFSDDHSRTATIEAAQTAGVNYIVIGRPILKAKNPLMAARKMRKNL